MRAVLFSIAFSIAAAVFAHGLEDVCLSFSTEGPDCYSDGSVVLDGECYALVWSADGEFGGFTAAGECVDAGDRVLLVAPVARDGRCPRVLFQVPAFVAADLGDGGYSVFLLDTRVAGNGGVKPAGVRSGKPVLVNGYGKMTANAGVVAGAGASEDLAAEPATARSTPVLASADAECAQPRIKSLRVDGGNVYLTVENLKGYMRVHGGAKPGEMVSSGPAVKTAGDSEETVLVAPAGGKSGFYRVIRSRNDSRDD